jgi:hypothetical protein
VTVLGGIAIRAMSGSSPSHRPSSPTSAANYPARPALWDGLGATWPLTEKVAFNLPVVG